MILHPYQIKAIAEVHEAIARDERKIVLTSPTGGGKSLMAGTLLKDFIDADKRAVIYTNKKLLTTQNADVFRDMGLDFGIRAAGHDTALGKRLQIASMPTEHSRANRSKVRLLHDADLVIVEECFVGETLVSTPRGPVRIDNVRPGDTVHCASGIGTVEAVAVNSCQQLILLEYSNGVEIRCTRSHPIFTSDGWCGAGALDLGAVAFGIEDVCRLWQDLPSAPLGTKRRNKGNRGKLVESSNNLLKILLEEGQEPNERSVQCRENAETAAGDSAQAYQARRERAIASLISACPPARTWRGVGDGISDTDRDAEGERVSHRVQGGHRESGEESRCRYRRQGAQQPIGPGQGQKENGTADQIRLVGQATIKRESPVPVFNLRVNGHPSYFANGILVHNCHIQMGPTALAILKEHHDKGAAIVGITATPLDMAGFYETLIVAGTNSELRDCGMLVMASHYGPDEPDFKALKVKEPDGDNPGPAAQKKAIMTPTIFARVGQWYDTLNPEQRPSILFGPGVNEALWFAEKFTAKGIPAAHIDGEDVWIAGKFYKSDPEARKAVADGSRDGSIKVVCNRYVLREGVNWPWIEHMILAYVVGSLQTYLQIGGRGLRASPKTGKTELIVQDHGGAWHRHGSLNADRVWELGETNARAAGLRADRLREKKDAEPWRCPGCARIMTGKACPCGRVMPPKKSRPVVMADGELREMAGDIYRPRTVYKRPDGQAIWEKMYFRSRTGKGERTFRAAMALFARESMERGRGFCYPDPTWPFMPKDEKDRFRLVKDVPRDRLL